MGDDSELYDREDECGSHRRLYAYVGPSEFIRAASPPAAEIRTGDDLVRFLKTVDQGTRLTFVVMPTEVLRLAPR